MFSNNKKTILAVAVAGILVACALFGAIIYASNNDTGMIDKKVKVVSTDDSATLGLKDVVWTVYVPVSEEVATAKIAPIESNEEVVTVVAQAPAMEDIPASNTQALVMTENTIEQINLPDFINGGLSGSGSVFEGFNMENTRWMNPVDEPAAEPEPAAQEDTAAE